VTDLLVLQLIWLGSISTDGDGTVYTSGRLIPRKTWRRRVDGRKYVKLKYHRLSRTIAVGKLVWMIVHKCMVPDGMEVDHRNEDCTDDRPCNLRLLKGKRNARRGRGKALVNRYHPDFRVDSVGFVPWTWTWPIPF